METNHKGHKVHKGRGKKEEGILSTSQFLRASASLAENQVQIINF
ncbi:hypothetical protein NSP_46320 [Nodularia spumigena CCY9414]|nr:hypothetical protein NSP_46320 [Nodularia spumigena CCY9414]EAW45169.1 hypothetical protein N9414_11971 [Nodularia spumigena CCY9414]